MLEKLWHLFMGLFCLVLGHDWQSGYRLSGSCVQYHECARCGKDKPDTVVHKMDESDWHPDPKKSHQKVGTCPRCKQVMLRAS